MRWTACVLALALVGAACSDDTAAPDDTTSTIPTVVTGVSEEAPTGSSVFIPWHERATFDPIGQDPSDCFTRARNDSDDNPHDDDADDSGGDDGEADSTDDGRPATDLEQANSWLIVDGLPLFDTVNPELVDVTGGRMVLHPSSDYAPTHLVAGRDDVRQTLEWIAGRPNVTLTAMLFLATDDLGLPRGDGEDHGELVAAWAVVDDQLVSFRGCDSVVSLLDTLDQIGLGGSTEELALIEGLRTMTETRQSVLAAMGVGSNSFRFDHCAPKNPGVIERLGFGGADMALAWGALPEESDGRLDLSEWTIRSAPEHDPAGEIEAPRVSDWPADDWFVTYDATDPAAVAVGLFGVDDDLGLYAATSLTYDWENVCDIARDVLAFAEFVAGEEPDRERWDLPTGEAGDEQIVIDTLIALRDDEATLEKFFEWTPCTYKLCVLNGDVPPRIS